MVGAVLDPANGYITALSMTSPPSRYDNAAFKSDRGAWASGYFSLCGENDYEHLVRNLICIETSNPCKRFINLGIGYEGKLHDSFRACGFAVGNHAVRSAANCHKGGLSHGADRACVGRQLYRPNHRASKWLAG
jgi:hypothetical protein